MDIIKGEPLMDTNEHECDEFIRVYSCELVVSKKRRFHV